MKLMNIEIAPAPITKPVPKRDKPAPKKDDPWTVPAPKVNPTPKANLDFMNKKIVNTKSDFEFLKKRMTKKDFYNNFEVSMNVVSEVIAEERVTNLYFEEDRLPNKEEMHMLKNLVRY